MRILVVDDDRFNLVIADNIIKKFHTGQEVILCNDPTKVQTLMKEMDFDIVLLDIIMPKITGVDILKEMRKNPEYNNIQVIMLTSLTDNDSFKKCFENGADDYINKPIRELEFNARFKAAVKTRRNAMMLKDMFERIKKQNDELKNLNKTLKDTQFHVIQKEKLAAIGELAAGIAHEINNPLGFVGSNLETLSKFISKVQVMNREYKKLVEVLNSNEQLIEDSNINNILTDIKNMEKSLKFNFIIDELDEIIEDSRDGVNRVSKIVKSLQNFAKTGFEEEMAVTDLNMIIDEALLLLNNDLKKVATIEKKYNTITQMLCNRSQIGRVILSLITNSLQAIQSQHRMDGHITIETFREENLICCSISDDGPGIKPEIINNIFNPFFTTKEIGSATGVGLSISHDIIVKKCSGEFNVESIPGEKTTFTFKLPVVCS